MCELFGFSAPEKIDIKESLTNFFAHSVKNPHGWGLLDCSKSDYELIREPLAAFKSQLLKQTLEIFPPQKNAIAHIRYATIGSIKEVNCHPHHAKDSSGREWFLIHNGTIYSGKYLTKFLSTQTGDTDSERILLFLVEEINKVQNGTPLSARRRFEIIEESVRKLSHRNKLNLMIFDGELLYVHKNMNNSLYYKREGNSIFFATMPFDEGEWKAFPLSQLYAFQNGQKIFSGNKRSEIFIPHLDFVDSHSGMNI